MSIFERKNIIYENSLIIYCIGTEFKSIKIKNGCIINTKFGAFHHSEIIGKEYGSKIHSKDNKGHIYVLHPTPYLWSLSLKHMTQILYGTNISLILHKLNIIPNKIVIEAGTGSGSLSHSIAYSIRPNGHLFTFEYQKERYENAVKVLTENGLSETVTVNHRDVITEGFETPQLVDTVVLDLPSPWMVIMHAKKSLKNEEGANICIFSPCIEQVQKTHAELKKHAFCCIETIECLEIPKLLKYYDIPVLEISNSKKRKHIQACEDEGANTTELFPDNCEQGKTKNAIKTIKYANPIKKISGHTGYLTFAIKQL